MVGGVANEILRDLHLQLPETQPGTFNGGSVTLEKLGPIHYIKDRSEGLQLYYDRDSWTVGYINLKFTLKCYHTYHGYTKCKTEKVSKSQKLIGGSHSNDYVDYECPTFYYYFGTTCIKMEKPGIIPHGTFNQASEHCIGSSIVYSPVNNYQNPAFRSAMKEKV